MTTTTRPLDDEDLDDLLAALASAGIRATRDQAETNALGRGALPGGGPRKQRHGGVPMKPLTCDEASAMQSNLGLVALTTTTYWQSPQQAITAWGRPNSHIEVLISVQDDTGCHHYEASL